MRRGAGPPWGFGRKVGEHEVRIFILWIRSLNCRSCIRQLGELVGKEDRMGLDLSLGLEFGVSAQGKGVRSMCRWKVT